MSTNTLTAEALRQAVSEDGIALRCRRRLQPAGGVGDKVFPSTYEGGRYATEDRIINGVKTPCVLLDSVQSQANRIEQALKSAYYKPGAAKADVPVVAVDFASAGLPEVGWITSLDAPHRIADAILRDSLCAGLKFRDSDDGKAFTNASAQNATALFGLCPLALTLGMWDSTGPRGGLGTKIQRALVSEITAVNAVVGIKTSSRIDPLNIALGAGPVFRANNAVGYTTDPDEALRSEDGKKVLLYKQTKERKDVYVSLKDVEEGSKSPDQGNPSSLNHGNVTPTFVDKDTKKEIVGGVTCDYALQTTVLSLAALRRLHFPVDGKDADAAARTALAALGLCGAVLAQSDADLRSRCLLVPEGPAVWERIAADGSVMPFELTAASAKALLADSVKAAQAAGLPWRTDVLVLQPSAPLAELVRRSRAIQAAQSAEG